MLENQENYLQSLKKIKEVEEKAQKEIEDYRKKIESEINKLQSDLESAITSAKQQGWDTRINLGTGGDSLIGGLNIFAGYSHSQRDPDLKANTNDDGQNDHEEGVAGFTWAYGPVKIGLQRSGEYLGNEKTGSNVFGYANTAYGVSFNVSDNLSVSWGVSETKKGFVSQDIGGETIRGEAESYQLAYTMGGASIKIAETKVDNQNYVTASTADREATTIALSLAF